MSNAPTSNVVSKFLEYSATPIIVIIIVHKGTVNSREKTSAKGSNPILK